VVFPWRITLHTVKRTANPLVELSLPESITQQNLASQSQPASSSLGLPLPSALEESQVHFPRVLPARFVPSSGFGYPLDGLLPAIPCRFCFAPAALLGFTLRSFLLPEGIQPVSGWKNPLTVSPVGIPAPKAQAGSTGRSSWVFAPSGSPWQPNVVLAHQPLDAPLGFAPLGPPRTPWSGFRPTSSHALLRSGLFTRAAAPQSLDRHPLRLDLPSGKPKGSIMAPFMGFPHRPESLTFERAPTRAILFTSRRVAHYCRPTDVLWMVWRPTRVAGTG